MMMKLWAVKILFGYGGVEVLAEVGYGEEDGRIAGFWLRVG